MKREASSDIVERVAKAFNVSVDELKSEDRRRHVVLARQAAYLLLREQPNLAGGTRSYFQIAQLFMRSNDATIAAGVKIARQNIRQDPAYARVLVGLISF